MYLSELKTPVAVYDVEDKKLAMLFDSKLSCALYVFDKHSTSVSNYVGKKCKCYKNRFNRTICFRNANKEQVELLGSNKILVIDDRYDIPGKEKLVSGFNGLDPMENRIYKKVV